MDKIRKWFFPFILLLFSFCSFANPLKTIHFKTKNGATVVFYQAMEVPMLNISIAFRAGSAFDGPSFGLSTLTRKLLNQGNRHQDANFIADKLSDTGSQYQTEGNQDMVVISLKTLVDKKTLDASLNVFSDILAFPDFPKDAFLREKNQQLSLISQAQESPNEVANQAFFQLLYKDHPYAHPVIGTKKTVGAITVEQVKRFYQQYFCAKNSIIVLVGAVNEAKAKEIAEQLTLNLSTGKQAPEVPKASGLLEETNVEVPFPSTQTFIRLGQLGIDPHDPQYFPLLVGNYILGGGPLVSRFFLELREKRGFTYGIYSQFVPMLGIGPFLINFSTKNSQTKEALDMTSLILKQFLEQGPTKEEIEAAKKYLRGNFPLSLASNKNIADMLLKIAFYQLADDYLDQYIAYIEAVTPSDIKNAFQKLIQPNRFLEVKVGKL